jgi:hypothetical protein
MISVLRDRSRVRLPSQAEGTTHGVMVKGDSSVSYLVVWWEDGKREEEWLHADEVEPIGDEGRIEIGFTSAPANVPAD